MEREMIPDSGTASRPAELSELNKESAAPVPEYRDFTDRPEIWLVIRALRARNPIRQAAVRVMENPGALLFPPADLMIRCLLAPDGFKWKERTLAAWILGMTARFGGEREEAVSALIKVLNRQEGKDKRIALRCLLRSVPLGLLCGAIYGAVTADAGPWASISGGLLFFLLGTFGFAPFVYPFSQAIELDCSNQIRAAAARALGRLGAPESVGPLAEIIVARVTMPRLKRAAEAAFPEAVRSLKLEHYGKLGDDATPGLVRLAHHRNQSLASHALAALARIGDGRALPDVQRIARRGPAAVRPWAERALPLIEERYRRESAPKALLRPSSSESNDSLLRPTGERDPEDPDSLLRPADEMESGNHDS